MVKIDWNRVKFYNISDDCVFSKNLYTLLCEDDTIWESHRIVGLWGHGRFRGITYSHLLDTTKPKNYTPIEYISSEFFNRFEIRFENTIINNFTYSEVINLINQHDRYKKIKEIL